MWAAQKIDSFIASQFRIALTKLLGILISALDILQCVIAAITTPNLTVEATRVCTADFRQEFSGTPHFIREGIEYVEQQIFRQLTKPSNL